MRMNSHGNEVLTECPDGASRISGKKMAFEVGVFCLCAFMVRLAYVAWIGLHYGETQFSDFLYLHQLAESLAAGRGFTIDGARIFNQSIGYPAFLSSLYLLFGSAPVVAFSANILLGMLSVGLVYVLAVCLFDGSSWYARIAATLAIVYPDSLLYCAFVASENLLIPLMLLILIVVAWPSKNDVLSGALTGILAAAAASVKANVMVLFLFVPFIWLVAQRRVVVRVLAAGFVGALCLIPWTWANYRASGYFVPFSAVAGEVMLDGTNPWARGKPTNKYHLPESVEQGCHPVMLDRLRMKQAISYVKEDPAWYCKLAAKKAMHALSPIRDFMFEFDGSLRLPTTFLSRWGTTAYNALLLIGSVVGIFAARKSRDALSIGIALIVSPLLLQVVFCAYPRYRFPFLFCLMPFCAMGCLFIANGARSLLKSWKAMGAPDDE